MISLVASRVACKQALHGRPTRRAFSQSADSQLWWFFKMIICELIGNNRLPWTFSFIMFCNRLLTCHYVINIAWLWNVINIAWNKFDPSECVFGGTRVFFVFCCLWKSGAVKWCIYRTRLFFKTFGMKCPPFLICEMPILFSVNSERKLKDLLVFCVKHNLDALYHPQRP